MQEMILFIKACVKKVELCGKMLNKWFVFEFRTARARGALVSKFSVLSFEHPASVKIT